jgi:transposase
MFVHGRLSRPIRRRIIRMDRQARNADLRIRCRVVLKMAEGLSAHAASLAVGCAPSTGWRVAARFRAEGESGLLDRRAENGALKVDDEVRAGILEIVAGRPVDHGFERSTWSLEVLAQVIAKRLKVQVSLGHLSKVLASLQVGLKRARPFVRCPWSRRRRQRRIAELRHLATHRSPREVVLFADEIDIHKNPRIGPDWTVRGTQRYVETPGKNEKRYLAGAYDHARHRLIYVEGEQKASWLFVRLLRLLASIYRGMRKIHLILDNYVIHKSQWVVKALAEWEGRIVLHFLPPYCPQENRIERLWKDVHDNVTRNHSKKRMVELLEAIFRYLSRRLKTRREPIGSY